MFNSFVFVEKESLRLVSVSGSVEGNLSKTCECLLLTDLLDKEAFVSYLGFCPEC